MELFEWNSKLLSYFVCVFYVSIVLFFYKRSLLFNKSSEMDGKGSRIFLFMIIIVTITELDIADTAKALIRVDKLKFKGSKIVKTRMSHENFPNGSFLLNISYELFDTVDKELVSLS